MTVNSGKKIYLLANWKMYLGLAESKELAKQLKKQKLNWSRIVTAVFPSALAIESVAKEFNGGNIGIGAQNIYWIGRGGCTGEISAEMFAGAGCSYALVGHSERRHLFKETNHEVRQKMEGALAAGLTPVLCVGETLSEKNAGETLEVVESQLRSALSDLAWPKNRELIVAYEPVWAISKGISAEAAGLPCDPKDASSIQSTIARLIKGLVPGVEPVLLFGGSVRPHTVKNYLSQPHIDGVLVGAASTKLESWLEIISSAL